MSTQSQRLVPRLGPGSTFGIYSPSEPLTSTRIQRFQAGLGVLTALGYSTSVPPETYLQHYYMAGTAHERAASFNRLIRDSAVSGLMPSWGGKSSNQLLDFIEYDQLDRDPKLVCGFSDPTAILNAIYARTGLPSVYGPDVVGKLAEDPQEDLDLFVSLVRGDSGITYSPRPSWPASTIRGGSAEGILVGGNLSSFVEGVLNTPFQPALKGTIFFWETSSPQPRELHQTLTYLRHAGLFEKLAGMVIGFLGGVTDSRPWANRDPVEIVASEIERYAFPAIYLPIFGHGECPKAPIPIGVRARLDADRQELALLSPLCS